jgi:hypothetical protein
LLVVWLTTNRQFNIWVFISPAKPGAVFKIAQPNPGCCGRVLPKLHMRTVEQPQDAADQEHAANQSQREKQIIFDPQSGAPPHPANFVPAPMMVFRNFFAHF